MYRTFQSDYSKSFETAPKVTQTPDCRAWVKSEQYPKEPFRGSNLLSKIKGHSDMVSRFSPYLDSIHDQGNNENEKSSITDRFIPSRKLLKKNSFYQ